MTRRTDEASLSATMPDHAAHRPPPEPGTVVPSGSSDGAAPPAIVVHDAFTLRRGQELRGLRVHSLLGAGAMGNAYLASHTNLHTPVVIKMFRITARDPLAEAHLAARVVSPQVVPVLDAGIDGDVPFVVQRYVDGIDLEELLGIHAAADRSIPVPVLVRLAVDMFHGLSAIHVAGVVHRDIKPPNLFLAGSGEALVGDFGIAVDPNVAHRGEVAGTPMFIAPELWNGEPATPRSDLYSAAATLHLLWQRKAPFIADDIADLARLHCTEPYQPPLHCDPIGAYFGAVLARLLSKSPADRPESALGVARLLERVAAPPPELRGHANGTARVGDITIALVQQDICTARTDVIVSAANEALTMDRGVAAALRSAAGPELERDARKQGPVTMGQVVWTSGYRLPCREVAHAVSALDGAICIQRAVLRTLFEADRRGHTSITFPALGTGIGGVPHGLGARLMLETVRTFAAFGPRSCRQVFIALPTEDALCAWNVGLVALDTDAIVH